MSAVLQDEEQTEEVSLTEEQLAMTPGQIIEEMVLVRDERTKIAKRDKVLVEIWRALEHRLIQVCDEQGMKRIGSDLATATVTEETLPVLVDFDALWQHMKNEDAPHLLQRRVSSSAYRELQDAGVNVPGVEPYVQRKISLRKR